MDKIRLTKKFTFDMAHALYGYDGPCKNIHGHTYHLSVTVLGTPLSDHTDPKNGMVLDFSMLKKIVHEVIISRFDHSLVLNAESPHKRITGLNEQFEKVNYVNYQPTCENLLIDFKNRIVDKLPSSVKLFSIKLDETPSSFAEWYFEDNI